MSRCRGYSHSILPVKEKKKVINKIGFPLLLLLMLLLLHGNESRFASSLFFLLFVRYESAKVIILLIEMTIFSSPRSFVVVEREKERERKRERTRVVRRTDRQNEWGETGEEGRK